MTHPLSLQGALYPPNNRRVAEKQERPVFFLAFKGQVVNKN